MFCSNCGKEIDDKAVICIHCGCATKNQPEQKPNKSMLCAVILWLFLGGLLIYFCFLQVALSQKMALF